MYILYYRTNIAPYVFTSFLFFFNGNVFVCLLLKKNVRSQFFSTFLLIVKTNLKTWLFSFFFLSITWSSYLFLFEVFPTSFFFFGFYKKKKQAQESFFLFDQLIVFCCNTFSLPFDVYCFFLADCWWKPTSFFFEKKRSQCPCWNKVWSITKGYLVKV